MSWCFFASSNWCAQCAHLGASTSHQVVPMCQFNGPQLGVLVPFHLLQSCYLQRHPINRLKWHWVHKKGMKYWERGAEEGKWEIKDGRSGLICYGSIRGRAGKVASGNSLSLPTIHLLVPFVNSCFVLGSLFQFLAFIDPNWKFSTTWVAFSLISGILGPTLFTQVLLISSPFHCHFY